MNNNEKKCFKNLTNLKTVDFKAWKVVHKIQFNLLVQILVDKLLNSHKLHSMSCLFHNKVLRNIELNTLGATFYELYMYTF